MSTIYLDKYINDVLTKIYSSQNLCKYLYYDNDDPLSMPDIADTTTLLTDASNRRIYVEPFNSDMIQNQKSFLTICVNEADVSDQVYYKNISIDFYLATHVYISQLTSNDGEVALRQNAIVHELGKLFGRTATVGIGKNHYAYTKRFQPDEWFTGYVYCLSGMDFVLNH